MPHSDLNYRVDLQDADVRDLLASDIGENVKTLLRYDQVRRQIQFILHIQNSGL